MRIKKPFRSYRIIQNKQKCLPSLPSSMGFQVATPLRASTASGRRRKVAPSCRLELLISTSHSAILSLSPFRLNPIWATLLTKLGRWKEHVKRASSLTTIPSILGQLRVLMTWPVITWLLISCQIVSRWRRSREMVRSVTPFSCGGRNVAIDSGLLYQTSEETIGSC